MLIQHQWAAILPTVTVCTIWQAISMNGALIGLMKTTTAVHQPEIQKDQVLGKNG